MYDTYVTIVGNVLNPPEWRRTTNTRALVTTFRIASTSRRLDRHSGTWVDGNSLRVRVNCWRALAGNVVASVTVGDPLVVTGRLHTRDWVDEQGNRRSQYELDAVAVGHDLSRGRSRFERVRPHTSTGTSGDTADRLGGEPTEPVPAGEAPAGFDDTRYDVDGRSDGPDRPPGPGQHTDTPDSRSGDRSPTPSGDGSTSGTSPADDRAAEAVSTGTAAGTSEETAAGEPAPGEPLPDDTAPDDTAPDDTASGDDPVAGPTAGGPRAADGAPRTATGAPAGRRPAKRVPARAG